jgi:DNA-binding MarR family transcriptional regulator
MHHYDRGRTVPIVQSARLTTGQLATLELVREPRTISGIARGLGLSLPATSQIVAKLEQARLLRRSESSRDKRQRHVSLTTKGRVLVERVATARSARFQHSFIRLSPNLAKRFASVLREVLAALDEQRGA